MSSDTDAKSDLSGKVRNNRKVEEDGAQLKERQVDVHETADDVADRMTDFQAQEGGPRGEKDHPVQAKSFRAAALCLGVLCLLLTAGIIILYIRYIFQTRLNNISNSYGQLQNDVKQLQDVTAGKSCREGWKRFGCSCYFKSTENKTWSESWTDCESRGSDLLIINSKEEQDFVTKLSNDEESWIGLKTEWKNEWKWEWVDGSPLTETFWVTKQFENPASWQAAACCDQQGKWTTGGFQNIRKTWICEK